MSGVLPRTGYALGSGMAVAGVEFGVIQIGVASVVLGTIAVVAMTVRFGWRRNRAVSER